MVRTSLWNPALAERQGRKPAGCLRDQYGQKKRVVRTTDFAAELPARQDRCLGFCFISHYSL